MDRVISETLLLSQSTGGDGIDVVFWYSVLGLAIAMLVWNTIEVGRNDAANIVNAVFGSRVLGRKWAVRMPHLG